MAAQQQESQRVSKLLERAVEARRAFDAEHQDDLDDFRRQISDSFGQALSSFESDLAAISGDNELCVTLASHATRYLEWLQWTFWDLPYFAVALRPARERLESGIAGCGLIYLSMRLLDDLLDRHYLYRSRQPTLLSTFTDEDRRGRRSEAIVTLGAVLVCLEGISMLAAEPEREPDGGPAYRTLIQALSSTRRTLIGAISEQSRKELWTREFYERLIQCKNVDYWRILYSALDPSFSSPLYGFLVDYYTLAQRINDLQDYDRDEKRSQPNLVAIERLERRRSTGSEPSHSQVMEAVAKAIAADLEALDAVAETLPRLEQRIARLKLGESIEETYRLGLFERPGAVSEKRARHHDPLRLGWESSLGDLIHYAGADAVSEVACQVCDSWQRREIFRKHEFPFYRCESCGHIYVSPCVTAQTQECLTSHQDGGSSDPFLEGQRVYADFICWQLVEQDAGPRLLDLGFGRGYLLLAAHAHGFEVHGLESSQRRLEEMAPYFGKRLVRARLEEAKLPWRDFDVVVLSHVIEHLPQPGLAVTKAAELLRPGGLLYVAVPDIDSLDYRLFGKKWDAIHPLIHCQYFNEGSLRRLLERFGFEVQSRIEPPRFRPHRATPWQRLFRQLGGTESGELAILANRPRARDPDEGPSRSSR